MIRWQPWFPWEGSTIHHSRSIKMRSPLLQLKHSLGMPYTMVMQRTAGDLYSLRKKGTVPLTRKMQKRNDKCLLTCQVHPFSNSSNKQEQQRSLIIRNGPAGPITESFNQIKGAQYTIWIKCSHYSPISFNRRIHGASQK